MLFFFQAEDGIRDLVRSRGLGDVYKRQSITSTGEEIFNNICEEKSDINFERNNINLLPRIPVSYTHLTLPTSDLV